MAKRQDDRDPETDIPEEPKVLVDKVPKEERLALAIESMVAANQPRSLPSLGPVPTDADGKPLEANGTFVERDGKEYDCVVETAYLCPRAFVRAGQDPITGDEADFAHCVAFNVRVNFGAKKADNWKPMIGVLMKKDLRSTRNKQYLVLPPDMESHFTIKFGKNGKYDELPKGVVVRKPSSGRAKS